ncbi:cysteine-rich CWC family protein [Hylemonella gracilis]|uniref:cysteine-rich CWC family protein n=1 Tax=Hylemonella gracilis TaxID=80880 RepID=UPI0009D9E828|nr:cysteine-rich CWC family protein [Hylemonella gracilis]
MRASVTTPLPNLTCPLCGGDNQCAPATSGSFQVDCWCRTASVHPEALARIPPERRGLACLCPRCAGVSDGRPGPD